MTSIPCTCKGPSGQRLDQAVMCYACYERLKLQREELLKICKELISEHPQMSLSKRTEKARQVIAKAEGGR